jgi:endonuclease YncB( thermonuclease family)
MARIVLIALLAVLLATPASAARVHSFAFVRSDGSLDIKGRNYRLYGIHIPQTGRSCGRTLRPARCGSRAALALDLKLNQGWALALPGAPFSYVALERIAQSRGRGLWGFQADSIIIPNRRR